MEFDWSVFHSDKVTREEVAESFEDAFSLRFLPPGGGSAEQNRFFCLGRTLSNKGLFFGYSSNGKLVKVFFSREMSSEEEFFYQRKMRDFL